MTRQDTRKIPTLRVRAQLLGALTVFVAMAALSQTGATASLLWQDHPMNRAQRTALDASPPGSGPLLFMPVVDYSSGMKRSGPEPGGLASNAFLCARFIG